MKITDQLYHPKLSYRARNFDEQEGHRFTVLTSEGKLIETGVYLHWLRQEIVDIAVDISCMSGCTRKCLFCAAAGAPVGILTPAEIVQQVEVALERVRASHDSFFSRVKESKKLTFSFQGIGEPADSAKEILDAISLLRERYADWNELEFSIASILDRLDSLEIWSKIGLKTLQFSLHAPIDEKRKKLLGGRSNRRIAEILLKLDEFHNLSPETEIKINYLLIDGQNDSDADCDALLALLDARPHIYLKVSYLNETLPSRTAGLHPSRRYDKFIDRCKDVHANTYQYGAFRQLQISCGQLAAYAQPERTQAPLHNDILALYDEIRFRRSTLFLGAGAAYTAWDTRELARKLYQELGRTLPFTESGLSLGEIADAFEQRRERYKVDTLIANTLREATVPEAMYYLPRFPWRAIYTTNYDEFVERAYEETLYSGSLEKQLLRVLHPSDLQGLTPNTTPLIKLHGSVSQGLRKTLSDTDYLDGYMESIELLLNRLAVDRLEGSLLFIGYSFRDQMIKQWLYNLKRSLPRTQGRLWAVQPPTETLSDDSERLREHFGVTLIPTDFLSLMQELETLRRRPVLLASGSKKRLIRGSNQGAREGATELMDELCAEIARGLEMRSVKLISGATATDKVGHMIGKHMPRCLVTTYTWRGFEKNVENEPNLMISPLEIGYRPSTVVEHMLNEANVMLLVGGGSMALREALAAISKGIPVVPVAIGGQFASDIVHALFSQQHGAVKNLASDTGLDAATGTRFVKVLTPERIDALRLGQLPVCDIVATIFDILDHALALNSQAVISGTYPSQSH